MGTIELTNRCDEYYFKVTCDNCKRKFAYKMLVIKDGCIICPGCEEKL